MITLLEVDNVSVSFDGFKAVNNLSFTIGYNELQAIIGPNGAGKTTFMDIITGQTKPDSGNILWGEKSTNLIKKNETEIALLGIGRKFQKPTVFENKSLIENLILSQKKNRNPFNVLFQRNSEYDIKNIIKILKDINLFNKLGKNTTISVKGRHDPCVGIRAVPVSEAMLSCVLLDHYLMHKAQCS